MALLEQSSSQAKSLEDLYKCEQLYLLQALANLTNRLPLRRGAISAVAAAKPVLKILSSNNHVSYLDEVQADYPSLLLLQLFQRSQLSWEAGTKCSDYVLLSRKLTALRQK